MSKEDHVNDRSQDLPQEEQSETAQTPRTVSPTPTAPNPTGTTPPEDSQTSNS